MGCDARGHPRAPRPAHGVVAHGAPASSQLIILVIIKIVDPEALLAPGPDRRLTAQRRTMTAVYMIATMATAS